MTLLVPPGAFPLSTDSMALAHFIRLPKNARVLDLGSGCGTLGILLCARDPGCAVTGLEISEAAHEAALDNITRNGLASRMDSICTDLRRFPSLFAPGSFSVCISNPPYFSGGPESASYRTARREDCCGAEELIQTGARALKTGGDFFVVLKPERMAQLRALGARYGLECKRLCLLRHREEGPIALILLSFRKGARPGLIIEEWALHHPDGSPTDTYHAIYHSKET